MRAAFLAILVLVLEAAEPFTDAEEARPANADGCDAGRGSCPMAMIQQHRMVIPSSSVSFSGSAKVVSNVHFGSTADLNDLGYRGVIGLHSKHELKIFTRRLTKEHDLKIIHEEKFKDFISYKLDAVNGQNFNTMLDDLNREASKACAWLINTKKIASVDGSSAPLTEGGYREVADLRSNRQMSKFIGRVINNEGYFLKDVGSLDGLTRYHSCERDSQSLQKLRDELRGVVSSPNGWVTVNFSPSLAQSSEKSGQGPRLSAMSTSVEVRSGNTGIGITARLNEEGYQSVAKTKSNIDMGIFVLRTISQMEFQVIDEDKFNGMVPFYSGDKQVQNFGALHNEIQKVIKEKCAWIGPKDDEQDQNHKLDGKNARVSEEGYLAVAQLHSASDMQDFVQHLLKDMKMEVLDQGGVMGILPYHDCEIGSKTLKDLRAEIFEAAEKNTWVRLDANAVDAAKEHENAKEANGHEKSDEAKEHEKGDEAKGHEKGDEAKGHEKGDSSHGVDAVAAKQLEPKDQEAGAAAASSKDHEAAPPSKTSEKGGELKNKAGTAAAKKEERSDSAHGADATKQAYAPSQRHDKGDPSTGAEKAAADPFNDSDHEAVSPSKKDHKAQHSKDADAAAPYHTAQERTAHSEDAKVASSSNRRRRKGSTIFLDPPGSRRIQGVQLVKEEERLDSSGGTDAASPTKQPEVEPTAAPKQKEANGFDAPPQNHAAPEKPAHKNRRRHRWISHPNIESMDKNAVQGVQVVQIEERLDSSGAASPTKQPEAEPTAAPKEKKPNGIDASPQNHTAPEKPAHKEDAKDGSASNRRRHTHPNIESMDKDDVLVDEGVQLGLLEDRLDSSRGKDAASPTKPPGGPSTAAPTEKKGSSNGSNSSPPTTSAPKKDAKGASASNRRRHRWISHPNIESMDKDDVQGVQLAKKQERLGSSRDKDAASPTKLPGGPSTTAPKEKKRSSKGTNSSPKNRSSHERSAHKTNAKGAWASNRRRSFKVMSLMESPSKHAHKNSANRAWPSNHRRAFKSPPWMKIPSKH